MFKLLRKSKPTTASTPSQRNRLPAQSSEHRLRLMDTAGDAKAKVEHGDSDFPKSPPKMVRILQFIGNSTVGIIVR